MIRLKSIILTGWLLLFTAFIAEQALFPAFPVNMQSGKALDGPYSQLNQADPFSSFFIIPDGRNIAPPVPVIREPLFKWKAYSPNNLSDPTFGISTYPEIVQDIWRCPAVAFVLFPYHEFL